MLEGLFLTERSCMVRDTRFAFQCKSIFFHLFGGVKLFLRLNKGFRPFNLLSKVPPGSE